MNFWNEQKIKEALPDARLYNIPPNWTASGLVIWHDNIVDDAIILIRRTGEKRGILPKKIPELLHQVSAIMTTNATEFFKYNKPIIEIPANSSNAIINLARYIRSNFTGKVCAITGSSGKSTTTQLVYDVLASKYKTNANLNKFNTSWGISWNMTLFNPNADYWVIETSLGGGMSRNSAITKPDYAVITNIAPVHLKEGMSIRDIANEKSHIFNSMKENSTAILYSETNYFELLKNSAKFKNLNIITFGESENADIKIHQEEHCSGFIINGKKYLFEGQTFADHILLDMAAACAIGLSEKLSPEEILSVLKDFKPIEGRGETFTIKLSDNKTFNLTDESYNANPISMQAAIEGFGNLHPKENKILILGDMAECGPESAKYHAKIAEPIRKIKPSKIILCGKDIKNLYEEIKNQFECHYFDNINEMNNNLQELIDNNSFVMVKSSHSSLLYETVNFLKKAGV